MNPLDYAHYVLDHIDQPADQYLDVQQVRKLAVAYVMLHALHRETAGELAEADARFIDLVAGTSNRAIEHGDVVRETTTRRYTKKALRALAILAIFAMLAILTTGGYK